MSHTPENDGILPRTVSGNPVVPRLFRAAVEACAEGVFLVDVAGICVYANAAASAIVGHRIDQLVGQHLHSLVHHSREDGSPYPAEECPIISASTTGSSGDSHDEVLWCADGVGIAVDLRARPVRLDGAPAGAVVTVTDARKRRAALRLAQTNEQRFRRQFDHAPVGLALAALDGTISAVNPAYCHITGYTEEELLRRHIQELAHPDDREGGLRQDQAAAVRRGGRRQHGEALRPAGWQHGMGARERFAGPGPGRHPHADPGRGPGHHRTAAGWSWSSRIARRTMPSPGSRIGSVCRSWLGRHLSRRGSHRGSHRSPVHRLGRIQADQRRLRARGG